MIEIKHFFQGMVWGYHVQKSYNVSTMSLCDQLVSCFLFVFFLHIFVTALRRASGVRDMHGLIHVAWV